MKHKYWIFLDDMRDSPDDWLHVRTVEQAMKYLLTGQVEKLALDNDLGHGQKQGIELVEWMVKELPIKMWPQEQPTIHSMNLPMKAKMDDLIAKFGPYGGKNSI